MNQTTIGKDVTVKIDVHLENQADDEKPTAFLDVPTIFYDDKETLKKGDRVTFEFLNVPPDFRPLVFPVRGPDTDNAKPTHPLGRADSIFSIGDTKIQGVLSDRGSNGYEYWLWLMPVVPDKEAIRLRCNDGPGGTVEIGAVGENPKPPGGGGG